MAQLIYLDVELELPDGWTGTRADAIGMVADYMRANPDPLTRAQRRQKNLPIREDRRGRDGKDLSEFLAQAYKKENGVWQIWIGRP